MQNGMENAKFTFKTLEGIPSKNNLNEILTVYKSVFEDYNIDFFNDRIHQKEDL